MICMIARSEETNNRRIDLWYSRKSTLQSRPDSAT